MNDIPPLAWAAIVLLVIITLVFNLGLVAMLRIRGRSDELRERLHNRPPNTAERVVNELRETLRDPFRNDREQINQLSHMVENIQAHEHEEADAGASKPRDPEQK